MFTPFLTRICKVFALSAATLILPVLTYAGMDNGKGNDGHNNGNQFGHHDNNDRDSGRNNDRGNPHDDNDRDSGRDNDRGNPPVSAVPEANAGWVLVPFVGAVLFFSWRRFSPAKA
jgi:hypothetical protein